MKNAFVYTKGIFHFCLSGDYIIACHCRNMIQCQSKIKHHTTLYLFTEKEV